MDYHRREWHCVKCITVFGSQPDLRRHFKTGHAGDIAESQVEPLLNVCDRRIRHFSYGSCPLCETWEPGRNTGDNSQDFCRHLAQHLQQLALSAIPLVIDGLEIEDDDVNEEDKVGSMEMETVLGKEHPDTLDSMDNLAEALRNQGKYEEAEQMHRQALALREKERERERFI
ncbi:hypothetical protein NW767_015336 [Fusarium falciforme]|nr:hypothetical protein NW767_015336 [Fusarium falciforme]KAJ4220859.1 hypothetical protein NW757_014491 [Fusarium falciforme]